MRYLFLAIAGLVIAFGIRLIIYLGAFKDIAMSEVDRGSMSMVYVDVMGPYHKVTPSIEKVEAWAKEKGIDCKDSFGQYLDNPDIVEEARLKARVGCMVQEKPMDLPADFHFQTVPAAHYLQVVFDGSPSIGPIKVYPKALEYIQNKKLKSQGAVIEIYRVHNEKEVTTTYLFPLENP